MNNLTKTVMTIAVAGSLLFGGALSSQAADLYTYTPTTNEGQRGVQGSGELYGGHVGPDDEMPFPEEDDSNTEWDDVVCVATGKITSLYLNRAGKVQLKIAHNTEDQTTQFRIDGASNDFSHPLQSKIITEAWLQNLTVKVLAIDPCQVNPNGSLSANTPISSITVLQEPTE